MVSPYFSICNCYWSYENWYDLLNSCSPLKPCDSVFRDNSLICWLFWNDYFWTGKFIIMVWWPSMK